MLILLEGFDDELQKTLGLTKITGREGEKGKRVVLYIR